MPYTIVLTPPAEQAIKYVEVSQALCSQHKPLYLLTADGTSSPHITVVQFDCSKEMAKQVWAILCNRLVADQFELFPPLFSGVSFIEGVGLYAGTTWVELAVRRGEDTSPIMRVHHAAIEVLKQHGIQPLNASGSDYRPHLTLGRIVLPEQIRTWPKDLFADPGHFNLEFGLADEKWQYAKTFEVFSIE